MPEGHDKPLLPACHPLCSAPLQVPTCDQEPLLVRERVARMLLSCGNTDTEYPDGMVQFPHQRSTVRIYNAMTRFARNTHITNECCGHE